MNESLKSLVSMKEIKEADLQMGGLKAPGLDSFQWVFYHSFGESIVAEVNELVRYLVNGENCPHRLNSTHIVLIPKV